jgi:hypothetical protein
MPMSVDIEALRELFRDQRIHLVRARVDATELLLDASKYKVQCTVLPHENEVVAEVGFGASGAGAGDFDLPLAGDLVLLAFTDDGEAFVISRLSSSDDPIPRRADGNKVSAARDGQKFYLFSDSGVFLGAGGLTDPDEPLVLGNVLKSCLNDSVYQKLQDIIDRVSSLIDKLVAGPLVICGSPGTPGSTYPALAADLNGLKTELGVLTTEITEDKAEFLTTPTSNILSGIAFTER